MNQFRALYLCIFLLLSHLASAQIIPESVKKSFDAKYPEATQVKWSILESGVGFQINFLDEKKHRYAVFSRESEWVQTITFINSEKELPRLVRLTIDETHPKSTYDWIEWFESPDENYYIVGITSGTEEKEEIILTVTKDGEIRRSDKGNESHR